MHCSFLQSREYPEEDPYPSDLLKVSQLTTCSIPCHPYDPWNFPNSTSNVTHPVGRITRIMVTVADISQRMNCKGPRPPSSPNPPWYHPNSTTGSLGGSSSAKTSRQNPGPDSQVLRSTSCRRTQQRGAYTSAVELEDRSQSATNWGYTIEI
jgi:hypothetical protein